MLVGEVDFLLSFHVIRLSSIHTQTRLKDSPMHIYMNEIKLKHFLKGVTLKSHDKAI